MKRGWHPAHKPGRGKRPLSSDHGLVRERAYDGYKIRDHHADGVGGGWCLIGSVQTDDGRVDYAWPTNEHNKVYLLKERAGQAQWTEFSCYLAAVVNRWKRPAGWGER